MNALKKLLIFALAALTGLPLFADAPPTVGDVAVTPIAPFGLAVDYKVSDAPGGAAAAYAPVVTATTADGSKVHKARALSAARPLGEDKYRVYWNMAKDGVPSMTNATVSVTLKEGGELPEYCVIDLSAGAGALAYGVTWTNDAPTGGFNADAYKTNSLVLKRIDAGSFIMGEDQTNEAHRVTLTQPFYMALFETTQKQWELVMGTKPSHNATDYEKKPVEQVSYNDIRGSGAGAN